MTGQDEATDAVADVGQEVTRAGFAAAAAVTAAAEAGVRRDARGRDAARVAGMAATLDTFGPGEAWTAGQQSHPTPIGEALRHAPRPGRVDMPPAAYGGQRTPELDR